MNSDLQAILYDFSYTLTEVDILLTTAQESAGDEARYAAYNKSALLLLSGKFENFLEGVAEEYVFLVNNLKLRASLIPDVLKLHHSLGVVKKINDYSNGGKFAEIKDILGELSTIWATDIEFDSLTIDCKFSYGKHGENELKKLFSPLGIDDIFSSVQVLIPDESFTEENLSKRIDFKGVFNSVTGMRNNILHQNATPSLTHKTIQEFELAFRVFAQNLVVLLDNNLNALIEAAIAK